MGTRQDQEKQDDIWIARGDVARSPGHPFYQRLNELLDEEKFDQFVEGLCRKFYAPRMGRPGLAPGIYFRSLLIGYFEGIDSEPFTEVARTGTPTRGSPLELVTLPVITPPFIIRIVIWEPTR